jgi:hypothetical protein
LKIERRSGAAAKAAVHRSPLASGFRHAISVLEKK